MENCIYNCIQSSSGANSSITVAWIGFLAIIFASIITLVGIYITVDNKLGVEVKSKHRQDWINALRTDIAFICSKADFIANDLYTILKTDDKKQSSEYYYLNSDIIAASFRVQLSLNIYEEKHIDLNDEIKNLKNNLENIINLKTTDIHNNNITQIKNELEKSITIIIATSQKIFKEEWTVVKRGK